MFGGEHLGSPVRSPERTGESCIRPLCLDSRLCPKVAALPRYVIRIPPINPESDKSHNNYCRKPGGVGRIRLIRKACRSISDKV